MNWTKFESCKGWHFSRTTMCAGSASIILKFRCWKNSDTFVLKWEHNFFKSFLITYLKNFYINNLKFIRYVIFEEQWLMSGLYYIQNEIPVLTNLQNAIFLEFFLIVHLKHWRNHKLKCQVHTIWRFWEIAY